MFRIRLLAVVGVCLWAVVPLATGGPDHPEAGDAGSFRGNAQIVEKNCDDLNLNFIRGALAVPLRGGPDDFEDMYLIKIVDPLNFSVTTDAEFDTQLWLFKLDGKCDEMACRALGLLGNDNAPGTFESVVAGASGGSSLGNASDDCSFSVNSRSTADCPDFCTLDSIPKCNPESNPKCVPECAPDCETYLLAITAAGNEPTAGDVDNPLPIFCFADSTEVSDADGPGGGMPHTGWTGSSLRGGGGSGDYTLILTGAQAFPRNDKCPPPVIPTVSEWGLIVLTLLVLSAGKVYFRV